jgi:hypothetical protein
MGSLWSNRGILKKSSLEIYCDAAKNVVSISSAGRRMNVKTPPVMTNKNPQIIANVHTGRNTIFANGEISDTSSKKYIDAGITATDTQTAETADFAAVPHEFSELMFFAIYGAKTAIPYVPQNDKINPVEYTA